MICPATNRDNGQEKSLTQEAVALLNTHDWPGNIRALQNAVARAYSLSAGEQIASDCFPIAIGEERAAAPGAAGLRLPSAREAERSILVDAPNFSGGDVKTAAEQLDIPLSNFYEKMKRFTSPAAGQQSPPRRRPVF